VGDLPLQTTQKLPPPACPAGTTFAQGLDEANQGTEFSLGRLE
jgi:hypothetical protein